MYSCMVAHASPAYMDLRNKQAASKLHVFIFCTIFNKYRPCTIPGHSLHLLYLSTIFVKINFRFFSGVKMEKFLYIVVIFMYIYLNLSFIDISSNLTNKYSNSLLLFNNVVHRWRCKHDLSITAI